MAMNFPKGQRAIAFDRATAFPLDANAYFESYAEALAAARTADEVGSKVTAYYYGQPIAVVEDNIANLYIIDKEEYLDGGAKKYRGTLKMVGAKTLGDDLSINLNEDDGVLSLNDYGKHYWKYVPATENEESKYEYVEGFKEGLIPQVKQRVVEGKNVFKLEWYEQNPTTVEGLSGRLTAVESTLTEATADISELTESLGSEATDRATADEALGERIKAFEDGKEGYDDAVSKKHSHANKAVLDGIGADNLLDEGQKAKLKDITLVESSETNGNIKINGVETTVYTEVPNTVHDADYKHITVTANSVSDGTNTFQKEVFGYEGTYDKETNKIATADWVKGQISSVAHLKLEVVDQLPTEGIKTDVIYLLPKDGGKTGYREWVYVNGKWEEIGDTDVDLSAYATKAYVDGEDAKKVDKVEGKSLVSDTEIAKLATVAENAEKNVIVSIKVNGSVITVGEDRIADLGELVAKSVYDALVTRVGDLETAVEGLESGKVDKVEGKGLSTNDLTDELKAGYDDAVAKKHAHANKTVLDNLTQAVIDDSHTHANKATIDAITSDVKAGYDAAVTKVAGIEEGAQVNKIEVIKVNGAEQTIADKTIAITDVASAKTLEEVSGKVDTNTASIGANAAAIAGHTTQIAGLSDSKLGKDELADEVAKLEIAADKVIVGSGDDKKTLPEEITAIGEEIAKKVDKVEGKGLSTNDFDNEAKGKLEAIEAGAQVNVIESVSTEDGELSVTGKGVKIPNALAAKFGLVKGNAVENGVEFDNGLGTVHSLNVNKLVQTDGEFLVLDGGSASKVGK